MFRELKTDNWNQIVKNIILTEKVLIVLLFKF